VIEDSIVINRAILNDYKWKLVIKEAAKDVDKYIKLIKKQKEIFRRMVPEQLNRDQFTNAQKLVYYLKKKNTALEKLLYYANVHYFLSIKLKFSTSTFTDRVYLQDEGSKRRTSTRVKQEGKITPFDAGMSTAVPSGTKLESSN
jgi:hypothetical protein